MIIEDQLLSIIKPNIEKGNLEGLCQLYNEYTNETDFGRELAWDYIFQKMYIHASLKKQVAILKWLDELYNEFDPIQQIAMRQMFSYSRYLLRRP
jgi:hypothetical protein